MSDSNVGGRPNKGGINHIWVINAIIHDHVIQQFDYSQMFDSMDNSEACGDIYNYGINDEHLNLIHETNKNVVINVKTPHGMSDDYPLTQRVMQGDTWSSAMASAQVDSFGKEMLEEEASFIYKYQGEVPVPILGMVDDIIGVSEAGYKTQQLSAFINVKTADKDLQFGVDKCKAMFVSKRKPYSFETPALCVDSWKLEHEENGDLKEHYTGKKTVKKENSLTYLGHVLSSKGGNMENIVSKSNKAIGTEKLILRLIKNLGPYTYKGALIYIQSLIRTSILYAAETMYSVNENEMRAIERIEESALQKIFKTKRSCPRHLLYLESGMYPARNQIHRQM